MKSKDLFDAIGMAKDEYIRDAKKPITKKRYRSKWLYSGIAAVLACAILIGSFLGYKMLFGGNNSNNDSQINPDITVEQPPVLSENENAPKYYKLASVSYPSMAQYPINPDHSYEEWEAWRESIKALNQDYRNMSIDLDHFFSQSIPVFLSGEEGENKIYSPLNVYMALGMLAETTGGNSRAQVLELLGSDSIEQLRKEVNAVWRANYRDDGITTCRLANSLWLNKGWNYHKETVDILSKEYYSSVFQGEMGSDEYNKALQAWLNEQTGGLLKDQIDKLEMTPDTILALASTVWFEAAWDNNFSKGDNDTRIFHATTGDVETTFMNQYFHAKSYYYGDRFGAINLSFNNSGSMTVILPDEGVSPESLLSDAQWINFVINRGEWKNEEYINVNLSLPKFDVSSQIDLKEGLKELGVTDVFDSGISDFSPITSDSQEIYVEQATHGARVQIDEEGCTATAYTLIMDAEGAIPPEEEMDFIVDRPFLFVIYSPTGLPLFVGIVNQPQ